MTAFILFWGFVALVGVLFVGFAFLGDRLDRVVNALNRIAAGLEKQK